MPLSVARPDSQQRDQRVPVSKLIDLCRLAIDDRWSGEVVVTGELSGIKRYPSGHTYFTIKDAYAEASCIMFARDLRARNRGEFPVAGDAVEAWVRPTVYTAKGRLQLKVGRIARRGVGNRHEEFLALKASLRERGLFDPARKQVPPAVPAIVGAVLSLQGAAWRDVRRTLAERYPQAELRVFPAPAQGDRAAALIAAAIDAAGHHGCDVLLLCRGGGAAEDLWAYNELVVAEAIHRAPMPVITGIGHESDDTIADHVADLRAATPTGAAVAATPDRRELLASLTSYRQRLGRASWHRLHEAQQRVDDQVAVLVRAGSSLLTLARARLRYRTDLLRQARSQHSAALRLRLERWRSFLEARLQTLLVGRKVLKMGADRLCAAARLIRQQRREAVAAFAGRLLAARELDLATRRAALGRERDRLQAVDPQRVLARGFAMVTGDDGRIRPAARWLRTGERAQIIFSDGQAQAIIGRISANESS